MNSEKELLEIMGLANAANAELEVARINEIEAGETLASQEVDVIQRGLEGSNQQARDADLLKETEKARGDLAAAKIDCIIKGTQYDNAKRTLWIMQLIYQVRAEKGE